LKSVNHLILFLVGGIIYYGLETAWRGYSHWAMFIVGGLAFLLVGSINNYISWRMPLALQMLIGAVIITVLEFCSGCIVNIALGWNVWDYSAVPFNFMGQICLPFSVLWCYLSLIIILLDDILRWKLFGEEKPYYTIWRWGKCVKN